MTIKIGDAISDKPLTIMGGSGPAPFNLKEAGQGKKILLVAAPGAFTPTCTMNHLPSYVSSVAEFKNKGIDEIYCVTVNDIFVLQGWHKALGATDEITMLSDASVEFTKAMGMEIDLSKFGLGTRSRRYALVMKDGVVEHLFAEEEGPELNHAKAENVLSQI